MVGVELENSPTGPLRPPLNKLIIEVEMKILEKDMAILSYFPSKFIRTRSNTKIWIRGKGEKWEKWNKILVLQAELEFDKIWIRTAAGKSVSKNDLSSEKFPLINRMSSISYCTYLLVYKGIRCWPQLCSQTFSKFQKIMRVFQLNKSPCSYFRTMGDSCHEVQKKCLCPLVQ